MGVSGAVTKPESDTDRHIHDTVRTVFGEALSCFDKNDTLVVEREQRGIRVAYVVTPTSCDPHDATVLRFSFCCDTNEMWIGTLSVATSLRSSGLGRELVQVAEQTARRMGIRIINVFPFMSVASFWEKMGYRPHPHTARVLTKILSG